MLEAIFPVHVLAFCASGIRILPCRENLVNLWSIVKIRCILDRGGADEAEYQSIFSFYREERFVLYQPAAKLVGRKVSFSTTLSYTYCGRNAPCAGEENHCRYVFQPLSFHGACGGTTYDGSRQVGSARMAGSGRKGNARERLLLLRPDRAGIDSG